MVQHLEQLIDTIKIATDYNPTEVELKIASLETLLEKMNDANTETYTTDAALNKARLDRDRTLYREGDGLVKLAKASKQYISVAFGPSSPQYKAAQTFKFKDYTFTEIDPVTGPPA